MQLQFEKQGLPCLQTVKRELQSQEQTQELRISDGMPDIGSIIGAWGQVILRSKEWLGDGMSVSGGTMVWVQYMPEEGGPPQCVESWLPFQMRWSFPQTQHDGSIFVQPFLCSVDARSLSARKMMLRTGVAVLGWAVEKQEHEIYVPADFPDDIQIKTQQYPMQLPVEAGEKAFSLEETLTLPPSVPRMENPICFSMQPQITEKKMMGDKVVFRGNAVLHMLYCADDGGQYSWDFDIPFTQYSELDGEYGENAEIMLLPCVTALELEKQTDSLNMKAGLVCQYCISNPSVVEVAEDAYSPRRRVVPVCEDLQLPGILEEKTRNIHAQMSIPVDGMRLTDVLFLPQPVHVRSSGEETFLEAPGQFQILYYDMDGNLRTATQKWQEEVKIPTGEGNVVESLMWPVGKTQGNLMSGSGQLSTDLELMSQTRSNTAIPVVSGLELGEVQAADPRRPSLILRRKGNDTLWELAKKSGSTVAAIQEANRLDAEPEASQMLLIPIM